MTRRLFLSLAGLTGLAVSALAALPLATRSSSTVSCPDGQCCCCPDCPECPLCEPCGEGDCPAQGDCSAIPCDGGDAAPAPTPASEEPGC